MGGLKKLMPKTWWAMLIGGLALAGIPPLSGFFAKDSILASALAAGTYGKILFAAGIAGAFLTGLYTFRMLFVAFGGEQSAYVQEHPPHASHDRLVDWSMGLTVGVLAVLAAIGGWIQFANVWTPITDWLEPVAKPLVEASSSQEALASVLAVLVGAGGHRPRVVDLLGAPDEGAALLGDPRAQVLLRRALRPALLLAGRPARAPPRLGDRGADRRRVDPRPLDRRARGGGRASASSRPASSAPTPSGSPPASPSSSSSSSRSDERTRLDHHHADPPAADRGRW